MKFDFGEVLGRMWKIGWNHKVLWLPQMLPGLFSALMMPLFLVANPAFLMLMPEPLNRYATEPWVMIASVGLVFILVIPAVFVGVLAQLTTTHGALKVEKGQEKLAFRALFNESLPYFWRVLGLYAIFGGAWMLIVFAFMAVNVVASVLTFGLATICLMPFFFLLIPVILVGFSVLELAQSAIIADDMKTMDAISHAWKLFRANMINIIVLMLILYFGLSILSSFFIFPMMIPMMLFPLGITAEGEFNNFILVFFFIFFPLMFVLIFMLQGILMAFFQSAWAVAYLRLSSNANTPIIMEEKPQEAGI